jgi:integrase/recombinase XerD
MHEDAENVHSPFALVDAATCSKVQRPAADPDRRLVELWLHGRPSSTIATYCRDVGRLVAFVHKPIGDITLADLQAFADGLEREGLAIRTRARILAAVKSLLRFLHRAGAIPFDVGVALRAPKVVNDPSERALTRAEARRLIRAPRSPRDVAILHLLYAGGFRRAELCSLRWRSATLDEETGDAFVSVVGKGSKLRTVRIPASVWALAAALRRPEEPDDAPIFRTRDDAPLTFDALADVVTRAARRAKIAKPVSPHWLRHAHASHALDAGAPISLVRDTLGHASIATTSLYLHSKPKDGSGKYLRL